MIFAAGDTHDPFPIGIKSVDGNVPRFNKESFPEQNQMTRDDFVIICGDFGGGRDPAFAFFPVALHVLLRAAVW